MAKHYVCRAVTENPSYMQAQIKVPAADELHAGLVVVAETLDATINGNLSVYAPTKVADITKDDLAIVLDGGFETLSDGRRPDGQPDYTQYTFKAGEVVTAMRLLPETKYELSIDACGASVAAATVVPGDNLIPEVGKYELKYSAKDTAVTAKNYLTVEAVKYFRLGGQSGMDMAKTLVVRAKMA
jgi:hypothetical protein|nr:MAG TPA: hypothetical protein [Caudoviricetes sp.]